MYGLMDIFFAIIFTMTLTYQYLIQITLKSCIEPLQHIFMTINNLF